MIVLMQSYSFIDVT